jgi:Uma2 family endonuclease
MSMTALPQPALNSPLPEPKEVVRISVEQYEQMIGSGVLAEDDPIELLNGIMVWKMPKKPEHSTATRRCARLLERVLPAGWHVRKEEPVRIPDYDEPEPDVSVVRGDDERYETQHPGPIDIALIAEVADSSLPRDRGQKREIYARARIPIFWIVDLASREVECYSQPGESGYASSIVVGLSDSIDVVIDGGSLGRIAVAELFASQADPPK